MTRIYLFHYILMGALFQALLCFIPLECYISDDSIQPRFYADWLSTSCEAERSERAKEKQIKVRLDIIV